MNQQTLADRIAASISPEAWEATRIAWGDTEEQWNEPAAVAKREKIVGACQRVMAAAQANPGRALLSLKGCNSVTADDIQRVSTRLTAAGK